jgi:4-hydroxy-3-methylbut-2-enyl diphosphate reductase
MKILTAKGQVLFGVKRAIDISFDLAKEIREGVYTLGPIIHNPQVIEKLKNEGIFPLDTIVTSGQRNQGTYHRTHGIPHQLYDTILRRLQVIDATCPFVKTRSIMRNC